MDATHCCSITVAVVSAVWAIFGKTITAKVRGWLGAKGVDLDALIAESGLTKEQAAEVLQRILEDVKK